MIEAFNKPSRRLLMRRFLISLAALAWLPIGAHAADSTVTALTAASALAGTELLYCVQSGADRKCTINQVGIFSNGVFNVRAQYGAVGNGSTNNNTAITNALTAANTWSLTSGSPTIYFDCDTGQTTCIYNYNGSGLSPIKMLIPMTILCAPGVTLNYGGSAHAIEMGPTGLTHDSQTAGQYRIQNCRLTGGASYTAGIYVNDFVSDTLIADNYFADFGNQTAYSIVYSGNNWRPIVSRNAWVDTDGFTKNMVDAHTGTNVDLLFTENKTECTGANGVNPCSTSTVGVGLWIFTGQIINNQLTFHYPDIRISSCATCGGGSGVWIDHNYFEGNFFGNIPAITYGDPGTAGVHLGGGVRITYNHSFMPVQANTNAFIGPESASSGSFTLDSGYLIGNSINVDSLSGTGLVVQTNGGGSWFLSHNTYNGSPADQSTPSAFIDTFVQTNGYWGVFTHRGCCSPTPNRVPVFDSAGVNLNVASFHNMSTSFICTDTRGTSTAQDCDTSPKFDLSGTALVPASGDMILYKTTTQNTGSLTIVINGGSAMTVKKTGGTANVALGDIKANAYYPMIFDGTNLDVILGQ